MPGLTNLGGLPPSIQNHPPQSAFGLNQVSVLPPYVGTIPSSVQLQSALPVHHGHQDVQSNPAMVSPSLLQSTGQVLVSAEVHPSPVGSFVKVTRKRGRKVKAPTESKRSTPMRKTKEKTVVENNDKPLPKAADANKSANQEDFASCASSGSSDEDDIMVDPSVEEH